MPRSSFGSIERISKGRYRVRWWADSHDGRGYRRHSRNINGTRREASAFLASMQVEHGEDSPSATVGEFFETVYWPDAEKRLSANTLYVYRRAWDRDMRGTWGDMQISDVRPIAVQEWLLTMSQGTAKMALKLFSSIMSLAVRYELIDMSPVKPGMRVSSEGRSRDKGVYTLAECAEIADALRGSPIEAAFILAAFGSCRTGESLGAKPEDVEMRTASNGMRCAVVHIRRQVDMAGGYTDVMKTKSSRRHVVIPEPWSMRVEQLAESGEWLSESWTKNGPVSKSALRTTWVRKLADNGIEMHPFGNLRNSWRTYMEWELHAEPGQLELLMGHAGKTVTERHYLRPDIDSLVETVARAFSAWDILGPK